MPKLMVCPNCGGPLPQTVADSKFVVCTYCRATLNVEERVVTKRQERGASPPDDARRADEMRVQALSRFLAAHKEVTGGKPIAYATFKQHCEQHLQPLGVTETVARVAYNLALDAEAAGATLVRTRGDALARLAEAYMRAVSELRDKPRYEVHLPFLYATPQGPQHYARTLDVPTIIALSERPVPDTPAKKVGFWSKLFG